MLIFMFFFYLFVFLTTGTLKYHSKKFLELKPKDEVTLLSPGVLFWLILNYSFSHSFLWVPIFDPNTRLRRFFSPTLYIVELSQKIVCSGGKLRKSSQVLYRSDQWKYLKKINQNYFAHAHLSRIQF